MYNILICDDERDIVSALKIYLSGEDYNLFEAYDGREALEIVRRETVARQIREIIVTLGSCGSVYFDAASGESGHVPPMDVRMVDSSGAGDAFFSGAVAARVRGKSLAEAARLGTELAALTIQSEESNCPRIENFISEERA